jgi:hypothetical protein
MELSFSIFVFPASGSYFVTLIMQAFDFICLILFAASNSI